MTVLKCVRVRQWERLVFPEKRRSFLSPHTLCAIKKWTMDITCGCANYVTGKYMWQRDYDVGQKPTFYYTLKHRKTIRLSLTRASHRSIASATLIFDKCHIKCHRPRVSTLKALSISEEARFEITTCAGFYTAKRPAQSIFVQNGKVFTRDFDINLYRFFLPHTIS